MKRVKNIKELRREYGRIKSRCADDTLFMAKAALLSCEMLDELSRDLRKLLTKKRVRRKQSEWQKFVAKRLRTGKSMQQISRDWTQGK